MFKKWRAFSLLLLSLSLQIPSTLCGRKVVNYNPVEMSRGETISYFDSILKQKASSLDPTNEEVYFKENFAEDLYHRIDNLMPRIQFTRYLTRTKNITDKTDAKGISQLAQYIAELNGLCSEDSVWNLTIPQILQSWEGDRSMVYNTLEDYHRRNRGTLPPNLCNRFKGLMCQFKVTPNDNGLGVSMPSAQATCQCGGDPKNVGFYKKKERVNAKHFPDGCYVRPWRPCHHLSVDNAYRQDYLDWHGTLKSSRSQLAQMVFPVARPHRCKEGTYCMDMIPGMKMPVCWCNPNSEDDRCQVNERSKDDEKRVPLGNDFQAIRKQFLHLFILPTDMDTECWPDLNVKIDKLVNKTGEDPTKTGAVGLMKELIKMAEEEKDLRICDFRQGLFCDSVKRRCRGRTTCEEGKIHLGRGVCAVNNGDICQTTEECVEGAKCKVVRGTTDSVCLCESGYGDRCWMEGAAFFAKNFLPVLSGFKGEEFLRLQGRVVSVLEAWEDQMVRGDGEGCDPQGDDVNVGIMEYFGGLGGKGGKVGYDKVKGEALLVQARHAIQDGVKLCKYNRFLRCDGRKRRCVPVVGRRLKGREKLTEGTGGNGGGGLEGTEFEKMIRVEVEGGKECDLKKVPEIFLGMVSLECEKGFLCRQDGEMAVCQVDCGSEWAPKEECRRVREVMERERREWEELSGRAVKEQIKKEMEVGGGVELGGRGYENNVREELQGRQNMGGSSSTEVTGGGASSSTEEMGGSSTEEGSSTTEMVPPPPPPGMMSSTEEIDMSSSTEVEVSTTDGNGGGGGPMGMSTTEDVNGGGGGPMGMSTTEDGNGGGGGGGPMGMSTTEDGMGPTGPPGSVPTGGPLGTTEIDVVTEISTPPLETEPPARKAVYGEPCRLNDDNERVMSFRDISVICNKEQFIVCENRRCVCAPGLVWVKRELKCMIPLGERCNLDDEGLREVPDFLDKKALSCLNGACVKDNNREICRPETDELLLLRRFDQNDG